jgi:4-hydroxy-L-threonine phosphate dehydrogenase PdxA
VLATLAEASDGCMAGRYDAVVTAPLQKSSINDAGIRFSGHTEFFAERTRTDVVMMLASPELRVALVTTHLPLAAVSTAITGPWLTRTLRIVHAELRKSSAWPRRASRCWVSTRMPVKPAIWDMRKSTRSSRPCKHCARKACTCLDPAG